MMRLRITTPSRLHFGLLAWGPESPRQFGGVGLMVDAPGIELTAEPHPRWHAEGPLAARTLEIAKRVASKLSEAGTPIGPASFLIRRAPDAHVGLGVGTQLSLAVTRVLTALAGLPDPSVETLAALSGRGQRSGIGLHGFTHGGLIVDGGRRTPEGVPPLLARLELPPAWTVLVLLPDRWRGLHGSEELHAFAQLSPIPTRVTDRLCRLVLLGLLPAVIERDLDAFGTVLSEIQHHVGRCFSPAQGGIFAHPEQEAILADLKALGIRGLGQSSWGPTLYGFSQEPEARRAAVVHQIRNRYGLDPESAFWTKASRSGSLLEPAS